MRIQIFWVLLLVLNACESPDTNQSTLYFQGNGALKGKYSVNSVQQDTLLLPNGKKYFHLLVKYARNSKVEQFVISSPLSFFQQNNNLQPLPHGKWLSNLNGGQFRWNTTFHERQFELEGLGKKHRIYLRATLNEQD